MTFNINDNLTLGEKQRIFPLMVVDLINYAYSLGYELTFGDAYRDPRAYGHQHSNRVAGVSNAPYGASKSAHKNRLAIDLNLFKNGKYLTETSDHRPLGEYWKSLGGRWGGDWGDGNHYSVNHQGVA